MKKSVLTLFAISLLFSLVQGQDFSIRLFVTDSLNRHDTIEFGLNSSATLDVDSFLGEQDIYDQAWDSLDMRIIERDSLSHHCLHESHFNYEPTGEALYYDSNRDFKVNYRPYQGTFGTINMNFEILIKSSHPPIYITTDFSGIAGSGFDGYSALHLLDSVCNAQDMKPIYSVLFELNDTIYTSTDTLTTLVAEFQHEVSLEETKRESIKIYPNPAQTEVNVVADMPTIVTLYDVFGREIKTSMEGKLSIRDLKTGLYILRIFDESGKRLKTEKLIKK